MSYAGKMLAINAVAQNVLPCYTTPLLSDELIERFTLAVSLIWFILSVAR